MPCDSLVYLVRFVYVYKLVCHIMKMFQICSSFGKNIITWNGKLIILQFFCSTHVGTDGDLYDDLFCIVLCN